MGYENFKKMKYYITIILFCTFFSVKGQSQIDFKAFNKSLYDALVKSSINFSNCNYRLYALKIEVDKMKVVDITLSDGVDSLYKTSLIEELKKIDVTPLFNYLRQHNLTSSVFLKKLTYLIKSPSCLTQFLEESQVKNFLRFNGKEFIGSSIWLEPTEMVITDYTNH